jgi:hypothetical protein
MGQLRVSGFLNCLREGNLVKKKSQLSVILTDTPGGLSTFCDVLRGVDVDILAMSIQGARIPSKNSIRGEKKNGRRIAFTES